MRNEQLLKKQDSRSKKRPITVPIGKNMNIKEQTRRKSNLERREAN